MPEQPNIRSLRLVVVDDHDRARDALVRRLESDPRIQIVGATASRDDALRLVRDHAPHAVLIDTRRDDGHGLDIVSALTGEPEALRPLVVVHNAFFDADAWRAARLAGAALWLLKSIDVDALFRQLSDAVVRELPRWRWDARD
jgi:DNA-binding NarL/FixJ family response regulator